jgi:GH24 family phage-related lysozyme (muramidase)
MYVDVLGLVTVGVGCLIDPIWAATRLPFVHPDGTPAPPAEIGHAWRNLKDNRNKLKKLHWKYAAPYTFGLRLTNEGVDQLMIERLEASEDWLRKTFPAWDSFPADAQLGIVSMAWAAGANFTAKFPRFTASARAGKWRDCAVEGKLRETGPDGTFNAGVVPRNLIDHYLFLCAAEADSPTAHDGYAETVHWAAPEANA